ncbi:elongation factor P 5-aminopentanone reductase [Evansella clarkii]|uniref:elongation factor P 5-aminopentanone reductase n=1 Tax=Evansella clarkii TaxID=79879 RepID=UPI000B42E976|nr:SDR family oxidoreductase [Evansella clarkii]
MKEKPTAFISGASGDIGGAIARKLAEKGFDLILHYNKNKERALQLKSELEADRETVCLLYQGDFTRPAEALRDLKALNTAPEIIIHNSGTSRQGLITDLPAEEVTLGFTEGLITPFLITQAFLPEMIRTRKGKIIVISSIWGLTGASCEVLYSTVKGGLNTFVKALAKETAPSNIQVNGIAPGAVRTQMLNGFSEEELAMLEEEIPAGRLGTPEDIASAAAFLASDESSYINGQILSVNGAWYC